MELTLTTRTVYVETVTKTQEVKEGMIISYYGKGNKRIDNPSEGYVMRDFDGLYIEWDDSCTKTRLDGSDESNDILKNCGWY